MTAPDSAPLAPDTRSPAALTVHGGCHCGRVRFEVDVPARPTLLDCNCSICRMTGYLHLIVPAAAFRQVDGRDALGEYRFNTGVACHLFCRHCGIKPFYVPRSHPDGISVNARCLDGGVPGDALIMPFDDTDREASTAALDSLSKPA